MSSASIDISQISRVGYSAKVTMELQIDGRRIAVASAGCGRLTFDEPVMLPCGHGELVMVVDDFVERWRISVNATPRPTKMITIEFEPN